VRIVLLAAALAFVLSISAVADEATTHIPQLLLSSKLLRRLKRDRERQTVRWTAFENRVKSVPDSPQRGFELALYYAITDDDSRGKEAAAWASAHPCERRQNALIQDWVGGTGPGSCSAPASLRDQAFQQIAAGQDVSAIAEKARTQFVPQLAANGITTTADLYAAIELLSVLRASSGQDIRTDAPQFFRNLPLEFLLSLKPGQVEKPDWMTHVTALALVTIDPNLEASQFLQGWAMEDRQTLHEGPGVAYELLWADPYLPGIAYQNLDPWIYDQAGSRLFARSDWSDNACWISIAKSGVQELNCSPGWQNKPIEFGSMTLMPMSPKCLDIERQSGRQNLVIWKLQPGESVGYRDHKDDKKEIIVHADVSGMWQPGANVSGRICRR
jgi:hypothetical protein